MCRVAFTACVVFLFISDIQNLEQPCQKSRLVPSASDSSCVHPKDAKPSNTHIPHANPANTHTHTYTNTQTQTTLKHQLIDFTWLSLASAADGAWSCSDPTKLSDAHTSHAAAPKQLCGLHSLKSTETYRGGGTLLACSRRLATEPLHELVWMRMCVCVRALACACACTFVYVCVQVCVCA